MASIQVAANVYPVGETVVPSSPGQQGFPQRQVAFGQVSIPADQFTNPDTAVDFFLELQLPNNEWILLNSSTLFGSSTGIFKTRAGTEVPLAVSFTNQWNTPITVKGIRMRIVVRDTVFGSGLAQPVTLGVGTVIWN